MTGDRDDPPVRVPRRGPWSSHQRWTYAAWGLSAAAAIVMLALLPRGWGLTAAMGCAWVGVAIDRTTARPHVDPERKGGKLTHAILFGAVFLPALVFVAIGLREPLPIALLAVAVFATATSGAWIAEPRGG